MGALVDSSVWIASVGNERFTEWSKLRLSETEQTFSSPIVLSELLIGVYGAASNDARQLRQHASDAAQGAQMLDITDETARVHAQMIASLRATGTSRTRGNDLWLAASAIEHDLPLLTCNKRDFADIRGLKFIAPE